MIASFKPSDFEFRQSISVENPVPVWDTINLYVSLVCEDRITAIVPEAVYSDWEDILPNDAIKLFQLTEKSRLSIAQWLKIFNCFRLVRWDMLFADYSAPKIGTMWHRDVVRLDFNKQEGIAVEKVNCLFLLTILKKSVLYLRKVITDIT